MTVHQQNQANSTQIKNLDAFYKHIKVNKKIQKIAKKVNAQTLPWSS
ncbi:hypothetical protein [Coxiella burnetii]|uniref:Uncharacterized protein n=1 Tax=Coxiella burnetii (strain Dugway 5J108-111) TaxID=434922 RepID=A9KD59_COXBN|nr:hypothetical protein [Coxiella burnetii]ABS78095.1 hypothetical protein CBUD_1886 [Coxiella burnetii Dugway 5J108-111]